MFGFGEPFVSSLKEYENCLKQGIIDQNDFVDFQIPTHLWHDYIQQKQKHLQIAHTWKKHRLDLRLGFVAQWVIDFMGDQPSVIIDIGTDHAMLPTAILSLHPQSYAIAVDIHSNTAKLSKHHLSSFPHRGFFELADGFQFAWPQENHLSIDWAQLPKIATICGMGGLTMIEIIKHAHQKNIDELVLQPNTHLKELKDFLISQQWHIIQEESIYCDQRIFVNLRVSKSQTKEDQVPQIYKIPLLAWKIQQLEKKLSQITQEQAKIYCQNELNRIKEEYQLACTGAILC
jgi:tRNA A22 N-methylase